MNELRDILDSTARISFEHLNPHSGHETVLLRFEDGVADQTTCLLVDAGENVSLDATLADDEYLGGILLSHAHLDHYLSLPAVHRDGAPIYTSPDTARILETVLESGHENHGFAADATDRVVDHVTELSAGWQSITESLDVAAVPAGHTPGACGFLIRFRDGFGPHYILITGDFTRRDAAGYPGFELPAPLVDGDVHLDALLLTQATSETAAETLTSAVSTILERIRDGSPTLVTASGLTGVHLATLLGTARRQHLNETTPPIILAGHVAKLYADLDYELPGVTAVPVFDDPAALFERGAAVITGPEVPSTGGAQRCFETINGDANATLVQVHTGEFDPVATAGCTTYSFELNNHPPQAVVDDLVAELAPFSVVITHDRTQDASRYHDGNYSFIWTPDYFDEYTLYQGGDWQSPDWVTEAGRQRVRSHQPRTADTGTTLTDADLVGVGRRDDIDLAAEGIATGGLPTGTTQASDSGQRDDEPAPATAVSADAEPDTTPETDAEPAADTDLDTAPATDFEPATGAEATAPARPELAARIADLEATVTDLTSGHDPGERLTLPARVVDAGDDITLLRVDSEQLTALAHGTELTVEIARDQVPISTETAEHDEP